METKLLKVTNTYIDLVKNKARYIIVVEEKNIYFKIQLPIIQLLRIKVIFLK